MKIPHLTPQIIKDNLAKYKDWQRDQRLYKQDKEIARVMKKAKELGYMTKDDLVAAAKWKAPRNNSRCKENSDTIIKQITEIAFAPDCDEELRIKILQIIYGVNWAMASVILHFAFTDKYPILDEKVMKVVGGDENYNFAKWQEYSCICRKACAEYGLTMRQLDRVLWQMGKD